MSNATVVVVISVDGVRGGRGVAAAIRDGGKSSSIVVFQALNNESLEYLRQRDRARASPTFTCKSANDYEHRSECGSVGSGETFENDGQEMIEAPYYLCDLCS